MSEMTNEMTNEEAIAIIHKEYLCVDRDCDIERSCGKCDLVMPSKEPILEAYNMAIKALETIPKYKDAYNKGWDDGAKASYEHLKMCEEEQEPRYCDRNICISNEFNGISCDECEVTKSQKPIDKSAMVYEIYMEGVNMSGEYQGCWVRFKDIEKIVDKYMGDKE